MTASAILLVDVDVAYDGPAVLKLSRRHPTGWPYSITTGGAGRLIPLIEEVAGTRRRSGTEAFGSWLTWRRSGLPRRLRALAEAGPLA